MSFWIVKSKEKENGTWQDGVVGTKKTLSQTNHLVSKVAAEEIVVETQHTHTDGTTVKEGTNAVTGSKQMVWAVKQGAILKQTGMGDIPD